MQIVKSEDLGYYKLLKVIRTLLNEYSALSVNTIGKSTMGKDILSLTLGNGSESVLFAAAFHGSEHITQNILLYLIEDMAVSYQSGKFIAGINLRRALLNRKIIFVPCVNPDGCDIAINGEIAAGDKKFFINRISLGDYKHYNANANGVDINHNFNAGWKALKEAEKSLGITKPAPTRFGGESPESEPETKALTNFCRAENIRHASALHSQGEVIYWNFGERTPKRAKEMAEIMSLTSGYALDFPVAAAVGGGFKDWFITEFCKPAFTLEMGKGKNPLDINNAYDIYLKAKEMLILNAIM